jgi:hypothetical protein
LIDDLLRIDVEAEAHRLEEAAIDGPWQVPAELVRAALAAGARRVAVGLTRGRLTIEDDGPGWSPEAARWLGALLSEPGRRQAALDRLAPHPALIWLAGLRPTRVVVEGAGTCLKWRTGRAPAHTSSPRSGGRLEADVRIDPARAAEWLRGAARFAPVPVILDGQDVRTDLGAALAIAPLPAPWQGRLALAPRGQQARVWALGHGLVSARISQPGPPPFEAWLEVGETDPAAAREAAGQVLGELRHLALATWVGLGRDLAGLAPGYRPRVRGVLLESARARLRRSDILLLPLFERVAGTPRFVDAVAFDQAAGGSRRLLALAPGEDPQAHVLGGRDAFVLAPAERSLLEQLLGLRFVAPPRRPRPGLWQRLRARLADVVEGLAGGGGTELPVAALDGGERALLEALRERAGQVRVEMLDGAGRIRRGSGRVGLPRLHPLVRAAVVALARDPRQARVAALALLRERAGSAW